MAAQEPTPPAGAPRVPLGGDYWQVDPGVPLWGFADTHAHLMAHLAFGGKAFWGQPYDPQAPAHGRSAGPQPGEGGMPGALGSCGSVHGGLGNVNPEFGHVAELGVDIAQTAVDRRAGAERARHAALAGLRASGPAVRGRLRVVGLAPDRLAAKGQVGYEVSMRVGEAPQGHAWIHLPVITAQGHARGAGGRGWFLCCHNESASLSQIPDQRMAQVTDRYCTASDRINKYSSAVIFEIHQETAMDHHDQTILVTGATGRQGGAVARHLLADGWRVRALLRDASKPAAGVLAEQGIELVRGDLDEPASLERTLTGVYGVYS